jgi:hypothetical protein
MLADWESQSLAAETTMDFEIPPAKAGAASERRALRAGKRKGEGRHRPSASAADVQRSIRCNHETEMIESRVRKMAL